MNKKAEQIMDFLDRHEELKGRVVGYKGSRGGIGITRIDDDWYECDFYLLELIDDTIDLLDKTLTNTPPKEDKE